MVEFEWDPTKSEATYRIRGFDFAYASRVFSGVWQETVDTRRDYGKVRRQAIGEVNGDLLVVIYTMRGTKRRLISARRASRKERSEWLSRG